MLWIHRLLFLELDILVPSPAVIRSEQKDILLSLMFLQLKSELNSILLSVQLFTKLIEWVSGSIPLDS